MKLSLITATHHRPHYLQQKALPSVLAQSVEGSELEWIVVNDGSNPETAQLIAPLRSHFAVVHLPMPHPEEGFGLCHARNLGLQHATGEIVAYLDDDNAIAPDFTRQVLHFFEQRPDINFTMVQQRRRRDTPQKQGQSFVAPATDCTASSLLRQDDLFDSNGFAHRR
ncbi:MAG: glycosyltransferase family 2 protein [Leptolyngbya sp. SIOISBB]|nr:glycosyltransferase family 2 protein [Leptolyngbya sp. SIOISBB]